MKYDDILSFSQSFESIIRTAQVGGVMPQTQQLDTAVMQALAPFDGNSQAFFAALDKADNAGVPYSQHDVGFKISPGNNFEYLVNPPSPQFAAVLKSTMGPAMKSALDAAKINAAGYVQNNWIQDIPG